MRRQSELLNKHMPASGLDFDSRKLLTRQVTNDKDCDKNESGNGTRNDPRSVTSSNTTDEGRAGGDCVSPDVNEDLQGRLLMIGPQRLEAALLRDVFRGSVRVEQGGCSHYVRMGPVLDDEDFWSHRVYSGTPRSAICGFSGTVFAKAVNPQSRRELKRSHREQRMMQWLDVQWKNPDKQSSLWLKMAEVLPAGHCPFQKFLRRVELRDTYAQAQALLTQSAGQVSFVPRSDLQLVDFALQLCAAVALLHELGVAHRDIKPDNVAVVAPSRVHRRLRVTLIDFDACAQSSDSGKRTMTGCGFVGTDGFVAPEVVKSDQVGSSGRYELQPADVYSLGKTIDATVLMCGSGVRKQVCESVRKVAMRLMNKVPEKRPRAAEACALLAELASTHDLDCVPSWSSSAENRPVQV